MKVVDMAKTLGLPLTATEAEVFAEVLRLTASVAPPDAQIIAAARAKVAASGGKTDLRTAILEVTRERPQLVLAWRRRTS